MDREKEVENFSEWMEEEIGRQLEALSVEDLQDGDSAEDEIDVFQEPEPDVDLLPSLVDYMSRVQSQIRNFENELDECDILLHESDVVSARRHLEVRDYLEPEARKLGLDVDTLKEKVFRELEEEENEGIFTVNQCEDGSGNSCGITDDVIWSVTGAPLGDEKCSATLSKNTRPCSNQEDLSAVESANSFDDNTGISIVASNGADRDLDPDVSDPTTAVDDDPFSLKPEEGIVSTVMESDILERQSLQRLLELDVRQREKEKQRMKEIENRKTQQKLREESITKKRRQKHEELEQEKEEIAKQKQETENLFKKEETDKQIKLEISLKDHEKEINQLAAQARQEQDDFQMALAQAKQKQDEKETTAATKIQACYKGYRVRKTHSQTLKEKLTTLKIQREEDQMKKIKLAIKMREEEERIRKEDESRRMIEEEQRKKEEEREVERRKEQQKQKEEKQRQEEQRKREEMERSIKEKKEKEIKEELRKKKEKKEEECKRKEEEEKKQKEKKSEYRQRDEDMRKEEQRLQDESLKEDLRKRKEEQEKRIEEGRRKQVEDAERKQTETELQRETDLKKDDQKILRENCKNDVKFDQEENKKIYSKDIVEKKCETEQPPTIKTTNVDEQERQVKVSENGQRFLDRSAECHIKDSPSEHTKITCNSQTEIVKSTSDNRDVTYNKSDIKLTETVEINKHTAPTETEGNVNIQSMKKIHTASTIKVDKTSIQCKKRETIKLPVAEKWDDFLPVSLEERRVTWIKECKSWSEIRSKQKGRKLGVGRKPRRPTSAKMLPLLDCTLIIPSGNMRSLQQVTTVELSDLPGCCMTPLGQCVQLKSLKMNRCNLMTLEGLDACRHLHYIDMKHNHIEMVSLKDISSLIYLDLSHNCLTSIHGLEGCSNLRHLNLSSNKITRIGGLEHLRHLHTLCVPHNQLINSRGLNAAPSIQHLDLSHNQLPVVDDIQELGLLQVLDLTSNNLLQVPKLTNHVLLNQLLLNDNSISSLGEISRGWLPLLTHLGVNKNSIKCVDDLRNCFLLECLDLCHNQILDMEKLLAAVVGLRGLDTIMIEGNPVKEESDLKDLLCVVLPNLKAIDEVRLQRKTPAKITSDFEKMCLSHVQQHKDIRNAHIESTKKAVFKDLYQVDGKYMNQSYKLATEHRLNHEYGDVSSSQKVIPDNKTTVPDQSIKSARQQAHLEAVNMKAKFEAALSGNSGEGLDASRSPKTSARSSTKHSEDRPCKVPSDSGPSSPIPVDMTSSRLMDTTINRLKDMSAVKIQALWRGYSVRRDIDKYTKQAMAATLLQATWRGHAVRKMSKQTPVSMRQEVVTQDQHVIERDAAVKIQAVWRGYRLRKWLQHAVDYARFQDDTEDLEQFPEFDLANFDFDEADFEKGWIPPESPDLPKHLPLLKHPYGETEEKTEAASQFQRIPHRPSYPRQAWRNQESPVSEHIHFPSGKPPVPPISRLSNVIDDYSNPTTQRSGLSKKEEQIAEDWSFKDARTAEMMMKRARKLKYNALKKKKLGLLDAKQRLALFKKLENTTQVAHVYPAHKKPIQKVDYFQAKKQEEQVREEEKQNEQKTKVQRTYEWLHTNVATHDVARINEHLSGADIGQNLPTIDPNVLAGGRTRLTASPQCLDLESVDSRSTMTRDTPTRRYSAQDVRNDKLPDIKASSAPILKSKEKMSWRNPNPDRNIGWGGGRKRNKNKPPI